MSELLYIALFIVSAVVGYLLIKNVPQLLHTPLMSGMNALSGITVLGALAATATAVLFSSKIMGYIAIILAMINISGGFGATARMLKMIRGKES